MDFINEIITFFLGENALENGFVGIGDVLHALYYKDTPAIMSVLDAAYESFWDFLLGLLDLFMK